VRAERTAGSLRLIVQDDGVGSGDREGAGLSGMRARLAEIGGTVLRDGSRGTRLELVVPLDRQVSGQVATS
jgi:signal transduction histidine kinase